jgi:predicted MFS family arabinose efflux permease
MLWLLTDQSARHQSYEARLKEASKFKEPTSADYSLRLILRELRFYLIIPAILSPSFLMTGLIFHQVKIVEIKGWSMSIFTSGFVGLAATSFLTSLVLGPLVDRWRAINLLPFILLPLALALLILNTFDTDYIGFLYLICLGASLGATFTVAEAIWPEQYGTTYLGAINSFTRALNVFSSALAPWVFGLLFDMGLGILEITWLSVSIIVVTGILAKLSQFTPPPRSPS